MMLSGAVSAVLLVKTWRKDFFFAMFLTMMVVYSVISQVGYLFFPELSVVMVRMYFGPEALPGAVIFSMLSLIALYIGFVLIYTPLVAQIDVPVRDAGKSPLTYMLITFTHVALLVFGLYVFKEDLNYANAADSEFLENIGLSYKLFWNLFKFTTFSLLILYGVVRSRLLEKSLDPRILVVLLLGKAITFFMIASFTGNRTDPLAVILGVLAYEYFNRQTAVRTAFPSRALTYRSEPSRKTPKRRSWLAMHWRFVVIAALLLGIALFLLTLLEKYRGGTTSNDSLETGALAQAILLKDYYTPFHVLIGAMANDFVSPLTVLISNSANMLMFLKVDYLQFFVVELWDPGTVTRAASPAFFAFTEGFLFLGWVGFVYNGIVWALGIALWRSLSRTRDPHFNAVAFAIVISMCAVAARSQSSYFIKTLYLSYIPALILYAIASGARPRFAAALARGLRFRRLSNRRLKRSRLV